MQTWFEYGLHAIIDSVHLVFDPSDWFDSNAVPPKNIMPVDMILISHGHGDHSNAILKYSKKNSKGKTIDTPVVLHPATNEVLWQRINRVIEVKKGERIRYKGLVISTYEAGHCLGSLQFKVQGSECSFLFTGDINSTGSMSNDKGEIVKADCVAIEATAGEESRIADEREVTYAAIHDFIKRSLQNGNKNVVLYGHSLGKIQELTKIIGFFSDIKARVLMDSRSYKFNKIYEQYRGKFSIKYQEISKEMLRDGVRNIILYGIMPLKEKKVSTVGNKYRMDEPPSIIISAFPIEGISFQNINVSSHDDYNALINYIKKSTEKNGKKSSIIVFHGEHETFTGILKKLGYDAHDAHGETFSSG